MIGYANILEMCDLSGVFDEFYGEFNINRLVESAKTWKGAARDKVKRFIDDLFEWIPRLIRRILDKLRSPDSTSNDRVVVLRNENEDDAILIGVLEDISSAGNVLRDIIIRKESTSTIRRSEAYSMTVTTVELHTLNLMIHKAQEQWKHENAKKGKQDDNLEHYLELVKIISSIAKSLQRLLKQMAVSMS